MKLIIGDTIYKLSKAQSEVVQTLLDNRGNKDVFVAPNRYYNHQNIIGVGKYGQQFKKPTLKYFLDKNILTPTGHRDYLQLNPLAHRVFEGKSDPAQ